MFYFILLLLMGIVPCFATEQTLVLLQPNDYIPTSLMTEFEQLHQVKVESKYYQNPLQQQQWLVDNQGGGYDVSIVAAHKVPEYFRLGWLSAIPPENIPNLTHIDNDWRTSHEYTEFYSVPLCWGTIGIVYRDDLIVEPINSWQQLYQPKSSYQDKIVMLNDRPIVIGLGLKALNMNTEAEAWQKLFEIFQQYFPKLLDSQSILKGLIDGRYWMALVWNKTAITWQIQGNLHYIIPKEGSLLWIDSLVISRKSKQKELAMAWINFLHQPKNAARIASHLNYATVNSDAYQWLPKQYTNYPMIQAKKEILDKSTFIQALTQTPKAEQEAVIDLLTPSIKPLQTD